MDDKAVQQAPPRPASVLPALVSAPPPPAPPLLPARADSAPSDAAERIRASACEGDTLKAMHTLFSVTSNEFKRWLDADPALRKAFDEGKEQERKQLHRAMHDLAIYKRDINALKFLLASKHGYREQEPEESRNSVRIELVLPAAAPDLKTYINGNALLDPVPLPRPRRVIDHD